MFLQHVRNLKEPIRKVGCEFLSCCAAAEHFLVDGFSIDVVNSIWDDCADQGVIDNKQNLAFPDSYRKLFAIIESYDGSYHLMGDQVGAIEKGQVSFWSWYKGRRFNYILRRFRCLRSLTHTILLDYHFNLLYDSAPWLQGREIVGDYLYYLSVPENFYKVAKG